MADSTFRPIASFEFDTDSSLGTRIRDMAESANNLVHKACSTVLCAQCFPGGGVTSSLTGTIEQLVLRSPTVFLNDSVSHISVTVHGKQSSANYTRWKLYVAKAGPGMASVMTQAFVGLQLGRYVSSADIEIDSTTMVDGDDEFSYTLGGGPVKFFLTATNESSGDYGQLYDISITAFRSE